jgi:UDP-2-acetamido-3-amino-2,3-dideoxy-glucuronate N-acetyltransferase
MTSKIDPTAYIHPSSVIDEGCSIGKNVKIWHFCHIMSGAKIGDNTSIGQGCYIASDVVIGKNCKIQNHVSIYDGVTLEDSVFIGPSVVFTNVKFPRSHRKGKYEKTILRTGCTIGANSTIICGIEIGQWSMVAAGCVATRTVPPGVTIMGVPGVVKRSRAHQQELRGNSLTKENT